MNTSSFRESEAILLRPHPPYDFALTINAARFYSVRGKQQDGAYRRVLHLRTGLALVEIRDAGSAQEPLLQVRLLAANHEADRREVEERLASLLNLDLDLRPFYVHAESDSVLLNTTRQLYGLRTLLMDTFFEAAILSIIEQQIALRMAHAAERWLMVWAGEYIDYEGERYYGFPTPERLAQLTPEDLKPLKITGQRIGRILDIARGVADGTLDLEGLRQLSPDEAYAVLRGIKGIGHWTASWIVIKGLGHFANFGSGDVGLRAAINAYYYGQSGNAEHAVVDALLARYHPYEGTAAFFTLTRWALEKYTYI